MDKHPESGFIFDHVGDGVYAEWDGGRTWLRVNYHMNSRVVCLEPETIRRLYKFHMKMERASRIEIAKSIAFEALNKSGARAAYDSFIAQMQGIDTLHDGDRIMMTEFVSDIMHDVELEEEKVAKWLNSFD